MTQKSKFLLIGLLWLAMIGGFIFSKQMTLLTGTEVLLKTVPVDPRDLFRGDYVVLRYDISTVDLNNVRSVDENFNSVVGKRVYVTLDLENGRGKVGDVLFSPPPSGLFMKGTITSANASRITVEYGIESYFVPEGKGRDIEVLRGDMEAKVAVDRSGNASIKSLWVNGREIIVK
jgi:uncharacterized membrane-anchored protein